MEIIRLKEENQLIKKQLIDEQSKHIAKTTTSGSFKMYNILNYR
jgi:hypothetical protein